MKKKLSKEKKSERIHFSANPSHHRTVLARLRCFIVFAEFPNHKMFEL